MSYLAIYRRFRPSTFDKMIGQEQVVKTLVNQIKNGRVGHAYLFTGARGTGKTTAAKIFARAINCLEPVNGSPCGKCEVCQKLSDPQNLDILEIDAASNNKVDNVREIRDKIQYPPIAGAYKVYIIDEAHMLTNEAFNALLKTLEEPPKHAVIILATTEPHKLPATILSRCMRFDFKLVAEKTIAKLIKDIYDELGKSYEEEAITAIARAGEGSVRDALSVADTCVSYTDEKLTYNDVIEVLGTSDTQRTLMLAKAVLESDIGGVLSVTDRLVSAGKSVSLLARDLSNVFRNLIIVKTCDDGAAILNIPEHDYAALKDVASVSDGHGIFRAAEIFAGVETDLRYSTNARVVFETAAIKAAMPASDYNIDALISRINKLETALENGNFQKPHSAEKPADKPVIEQKPIISEEKAEKETVKEEVKEAEKETEKKTPSFDPAYSAYIAEYDDDDAPPEDNFPVENQIGFDMDSVPMGEDDGRVEYSAPEEKPVDLKKAEAASPAPTETAETEKPKFSDARVWGTVIRRLRAEKKIMLWIACQEQEAATVDGKFVITVDGENEYSTIAKPENLALIRGIIGEMITAEVEVVKRGEEKTDGFEKDVEKVKEAFPDVKIVK